MDDVLLLTKTFEVSINTDVPGFKAVPGSQIKACVVYYYSDPLYLQVQANLI